MTPIGHPQNPLTGYTSADGDYDIYLAELTAVFREIAGQLRPYGHAVLNVANLVTADAVTPLARRLARRASAAGILRTMVSGY
jgi:hypothetical protein